MSSAGAEIDEASRGGRPVLREPLDEERDDQQHAFDARQRGEEAEDAGEPPRRARM